MVKIVKCPKCGKDYRKTIKPFQEINVLCPWCLTWHTVRIKDVVG